VRLPRDQPGQVVEELAAVREQRVDLLMRAVDERHRGRIRRFRQRIDPDALHQGSRLDRLAVYLETTHAEHDAVGGRPADKTAARDLAVVVGRQQEEPAALTLVRAGRAEFFDKTWKPDDIVEVK
jgi:hypothetical protein